MPIDLWLDIERLGEFDYNGLNIRYSLMYFRFCFPTASDYIWSCNNSCFESFVEVLACYAPLIRHALTLDLSIHMLNYFVEF